MIGKEKKKLRDKLLELSGKVLTTREALHLAIEKVLDAKKD